MCLCPHLSKSPLLCNITMDGNLNANRLYFHSVAEYMMKLFVFILQKETSSGRPLNVVGYPVVRPTEYIALAMEQIKPPPQLALQTEAVNAVAQLVTAYLKPSELHVTVQIDHYY